MSDLLTAVILSGQGAFLLVTLLLLLRRVGGNLHEPLGSGLFLLVALVIALLTLALRGAWLMRDQEDLVSATSLTNVGFRRLVIARLRRQRRASLAMLPLPGLTQLVLLSALSIPGTPAWSMMLGWVLFLASESVTWWLLYGLSRKQSAPVRGEVGRPAPNRSFGAGLQTPSNPPTEGLPAAVFQQITRSRDGETEWISGVLRADFAAGQRLAVLHIAFCPPLDSAPDLAFEPSEGPDAMVTATLLESFGARLEVRLEEPADEPCSVILEMHGAARR